MIGSLVQHMRAGSPKEGSFSALLQAVEDPTSGKPLDDAALLPEVAALFFAGVDTTYNTICYALCALAHHLTASSLLSCMASCSLDNDGQAAGPVLSMQLRSLPHALVLYVVCACSPPAEGVSLAGTCCPSTRTRKLQWCRSWRRQVCWPRLQRHSPGS